MLWCQLGQDEAHCGIGRMSISFQPEGRRCCEASAMPEGSVGLTGEPRAEETSLEVSAPGPHTNHLHRFRSPSRVFGYLPLFCKLKRAVLLVYSHKMRNICVMSYFSFKVLLFTFYLTREGQMTGKCRFSDAIWERQSKWLALGYSYGMHLGKRFKEMSVKAALKSAGHSALVPLRLC